MRTLMMIAAFVVFGTASAYAQIAVEILNMSSEVYSFGPAYVLYAVENTGKTPLYLPAEAAPQRGPGIYLAAAGEEPAPVPGPVSRRRFPHTMRTMWLAPGERWLFYEDIGHQLRTREGEISVQAVMSSDGLCHDQQIYGRRSFPVEPLHVETLQRGAGHHEVYRCRQGESRSSVWNINVRQPTSEVDRLAFEFLLRNRGLIHVEESGAWQLSAFAYRVKEKYPTSHYAYATLAQQTSVYAKREAIDLQPNHPLNQWVAAAIARDVLDHHSSCWPHATLKPDFSTDDLEFPEQVREYLTQYAWYLENRHCPRIFAGRASKETE